MKQRQVKQLSNGYIVLIVIAYIASLLAVLQIHHFQINQHMDAKSQRVEATFRHSLMKHETLAQFVYLRALNQQETINILADAPTVSESERVALRNDLKQLFLPVFDLFIAFDVTNIRFRLPNNDVFLSMQSDDDLSRIVESRDKYALQQPSSSHLIQGFNFTNGEINYQFVLPFFKDDNFVGAMEIVLPIDKLFADMGFLLSTTQLALVLKDDVSGIGQNEADFARFSCALSTNENLYFHNVVATTSTSALLSQSLFQSNACAQIVKTPDKLTGFAFIYNAPNARQLVNFYVIKDINQENIGYIFSATQSETLNAIYDESLQLTLVATLVMLVLIFLFIAIQRQRKFIARHALFDPLTGIYNRAIFADFAQKFVVRQERDKSSISVAVIDVDYFKSINDTYGHQVGDKVLIEVVNIISSLIRKADLFARFGGDEFVIMFPDTDIIVAKSILERVSQHVNQSKFTKVESVSLSIGVHEKHVNETLEEAINNADKALYEAKNQGKNRIVESKLSNLG